MFSPRGEFWKCCGFHSNTICPYTPPASLRVSYVPQQSIFAIVLAAGESSRFGSTKQLSEFEGESLVRRAVRLAEDVCRDHTVLVVGNDWKRVLAACGPQRGFFLRNEEFSSGLASSIACGVRSVAHAANAILLLMADQPLITAAHLDALIAHWSGAPENIVVSEYSGTRGPPVIFPARCFESLSKLQGDRGARSVLSDSRYLVSGIGFDAAAIDIDTPADLAKL